jgi:hypothetical protein
VPVPPGLPPARPAAGTAAMPAAPDPAARWAAGTAATGYLRLTGYDGTENVATVQGCRSPGPPAHGRQDPQLRADIGAEAGRIVVEQWDRIVRLAQRLADDGGVGGLIDACPGTGPRQIGRNTLSRPRGPRCCSARSRHCRPTPPAAPARPRLFVLCLRGCDRAGSSCTMGSGTGVDQGFEQGFRGDSPFGGLVSRAAHVCGAGAGSVASSSPAWDRRVRRGMSPPWATSLCPLHCRRLVFRAALAFAHPVRP